MIRDPLGRLTRLIKHSTGETKELIRHCIQEPPSEGYKHARTLLSEQFGKPYYISSAYIRELKQMKQLKRNDTVSFRKFHRFLMKCNASMQNGRYLQELDSPHFIRLLQSKLPTYMQEKWTRKAVEYRVRNSKELGFSEYLALITMENMVLNDPMYSKSAVSELFGKREFSKFNNFAMNFRPTTEEIQCEIVCLYCNHCHDIDECENFKAMPYRDRKQLFMPFQV